MHEPITKYPAGKVLGNVRLAKGAYLIDVTRVKHGSMTTFVERVRRAGPTGQVQVAFRRTDWFPSDTIADRFIAAWLDGVQNNRYYRVIQRDPLFLQD